MDSRIIDTAIYGFLRNPGQAMVVQKEAHLIPIRAILILILLGSVVGCKTPLNVNPPSDFKLDGIWDLAVFESDAPPDPMEIRDQEDRDVVVGIQRNVAASSEFVETDFPVIGAVQMVIEQNADSMGIEYSNGEYRDVSWGERDRDFWHVRAGWKEGNLVIESRRDLIKGVETMSLVRGGRRLRVDVFVHTGGRDVRVRRVFDRR